MTCKEVQQKLADAFDRDELVTLPPEVRNHLQHCAACRSYLEQLEQLDVGLRQLPAVKTSPRFSAEELRKLTEFLEREQSPTRRKSLRWQRAILAAAAALLMVLGSFLLPRLNHSPAPKQPEFYLRSLDSPNSVATPIVFQSEKEQSPLIIWLN